MYKEGFTKPAQIHRRTGYTYPMIKRTIDRYLETNDVADKPRSGRPKILKNQELVTVKKSLKRKRRGSTRSTAKRVKRSHDVDVSHQTIWRAGKAMGLVYRKRPKKPLLTKRHRQARLKFARKRRGRRFWHRVLWSDEASFALYSDTEAQWVEEGEQPKNRQTTKWPARIRVWAGISAQGKTKLIRIPKRMNADAYIDMLGRKGIPQARSIFKDERKGWMFMQDGDGSHTAKRTKDWLHKEGVKVLDPWPAHSPDLNPIENAWALVEQGLRKKNPRTEDGLWRAMKKSWKKIDEKKLCNLCLSLPNRLDLVIAADGGSTKY